MKGFDRGRPRNSRASEGGPRVPRLSRTEKRWRLLGQLVLIAATALLVVGVVMGQGLLIATGLILAGIAGHLFTPEFRSKSARHRSS